jgi:hypothetical protein
MSIGRRSWIFLGPVEVELDLALSFLNQMVGGACQVRPRQQKRAAKRRSTDPLRAGETRTSTTPFTLAIPPNTSDREILAVSDPKRDTFSENSKF